MPPWGGPITRQGRDFTPVGNHGYRNSGPDVTGRKNLRGCPWAYIKQRFAFRTLLVKDSLRTRQCRYKRGNFALLYAVGFRAVWSNSRSSALASPEHFGPCTGLLYFHANVWAMTQQTSECPTGVRKCVVTWLEHSRESKKRYPDHSWRSSIFVTDLWPG